MEFIGVQPGWIALDLFGGGGYYSEVLAQQVDQLAWSTLHNDQATKVTPSQLQGASEASRDVLGAAKSGRTLRY